MRFFAGRSWWLGVPDPPGFAGLPGRCHRPGRNLSHWAGMLNLGRGRGKDRAFSRRLGAGNPAENPEKRDLDRAALGARIGPEVKSDFPNSDRPKKSITLVIPVMLVSRCVACYSRNRFGRATRNVTKNLAWE